MGEWKRYTLEQIAAPGKNSIATGPFGSAISSRHFTDKGVPVLRGSNLSLDIGTRLIDEGLVFISYEKSESFSRSQAVAGDLVFTCWGTIGQIGLVDSRSKYGRYIVSNKQMKFTPNHILVSPLFLYYALSVPEAIRSVQSSSIGSSVPGFNLGQLKKIAVLIPPRCEQGRIVGVLGALDDKIAVNERVANSCTSLAQAHIARALPNTRRSRLVDVASIVMGSSPPGDTYNEDGEGLPFYQGTRDFGYRYPSVRIFCSAPVRTAPAGATLVSVRAPVGRVNVAKEDCCIGRGLASLVSNHGSPSVLFHTLSSIADVWSPYESEGTVFGSINKNQLQGIEVPVFEAETLGKLESILSSLDSSVRSATDESGVLAQLRDTLLPKLMSGEIRVKDAERLLEEVT